MCVLNARAGRTIIQRVIFLLILRLPFHKKRKKEEETNERKIQRDDKQTNRQTGGIKNVS